MTHEEEEDESAWLGGSLEPKDEEIKGELDKMVERISKVSGLSKEELMKDHVRPITKKEKDPDYDPDFDEIEEEETGELDLPETKEEAKEELTALEKELEEKRRRLEMTPSERRAEDERIRKEREEEYKKARTGAKIPASRPPGIPSPPTGTGVPIPTAVAKPILGECCKRMNKELLEKTNVQWWNDHKGNKLIAFSHTYLKLLHCPWCGAKLV